MKKVLIIMLCLATTGIWAQSTEFGIKGGLNYGSTGDIDNFSDARRTSQILPMEKEKQVTILEYSQILEFLHFSSNQNLFIPN